MSPSLSADGRYLAYLSNQLGARSVRVRDLTSGKAITLVSSPSGFFNPRISGDGAIVAYSDRSGNIFSVPRAGGAVETLCAGCGTTMAVSADGKRISYEPAQSEDLTYYDVERKARVTVAQRPGDSVLTDGRFSPDGKWMAFHARTKQTTAQVFVVPIDGVLPVPRQQWIAVTDGGSEEMEPAWSPNGELLYFLSDRDGFRCIWARRLNAAGKQPAGDAFAVRHFHRARRSLTAHDQHHRVDRPFGGAGPYGFLLRRTHREYLARRETAVKISVIVVTRNEGAELAAHRGKPARHAARAVGNRDRGRRFHRWLHRPFPACDQGSRYRRGARAQPGRRPQ